MKVRGRAPGHCTAISVPPHSRNGLLRPGGQGGELPSCGHFSHKVLETCSKDLAQPAIRPPTLAAVTLLVVLEHPT